MFREQGFMKRREGQPVLKKGKRNLTAVLNVPGNLNLRHWVWIYSNQKMFSISQRQVLEPVLEPALHNDTIHSIFSPPFHPWLFKGLLPRAPRGSAIHVFLVNIETKKCSTYNINILVWACVILKFPQTYFERRSSDVFQPNTSGVSLQSCMVMRNGYKDWGRLGKLNPQRKMWERLRVSFCKQAMRKMTIFWGKRIEDHWMVVNVCLFVFFLLLLLLRCKGQPLVWCI